MRLFLILLLCASLHGAVLPLALAPATPPVAWTPSCPAPSYPDAPALLPVLPGASYNCAEELAAALVARADLIPVDALLALAHNGSHTRARRNALRVLGRLAEAPRASRAHELVFRVRAAELQALLAATLAGERNNDLLQEAIWLLDNSFFPSFTNAAQLERLANDTALSPALRFRAATARARLVYARVGPLVAADQQFVEAGLRNDDAGVRAATATALARLRPDQLSAVTRNKLRVALATAWSAEPPLSLAVEIGANTPLRSVGASSPSSLAARAALARAHDHLDNGGERFASLRANYETLALPNMLSDGTTTIRSGLPATRLPALLAEVARVRTSFTALLGPALAAPLPGEGADHLTLLVFANQSVYRDYMQAFTPFTVEVDGVYDEASATLYTHERNLAQSENSLAETLRHELTHYLAGRSLFPGRWNDPGYHREPKGWADEGLAEVVAGLNPAGEPVPRSPQLARLCARSVPPRLATLLAQRAGYDRYGSFDYDPAWALAYYLFTARPTAARQLYAAYRDGSYRLDQWASLAGAPSLGAVEAEWHAAIARWCAA